VTQPRFIVAVLASLALVASAPFLGQARSALRAAFPGQFAWIVGGLLGAGLVAATVAAVARIRRRRLVRYAAILLAIAIAAIYAIGNASGNRDSDVVELVHFLQYGLVTFLFYRACRPASDGSALAIPLLAGLIVGTAEEWFQWFLPARVGEIRDLYLNVTAIACGLLFSTAVDPLEGDPRRLAPGSAARVARFAAAAIVAVAAFFHAVHLGHAIDDDEAGRFESRYSRDRLLALQAERAAEWAVTPPPPTLRRLSREDQYLTEAVQHAQWRNRLWDAGDAVAAWNENRILEKYYAPVLAVQSYAAPSGVTWPAAQRADAERRVLARRGGAVPPAPYVSVAYPYPIVTWNRWGFWAAVAGLCAITLAAGRRAATSERPARRVPSSARSGRGTSPPRPS
jgi:VanZ family protein